MSDKIDIIYDMLKRIEDKNDDQTERLIRLESEVENNAKDLKYHIKRTDLLEALVKKVKHEFQSRIEELEVPRKTIGNLKKALIWGGSVCAAIFSIYKLYAILAANGIF